MSTATGLPAHKASSDTAAASSTPSDDSKGESTQSHMMMLRRLRDVVRGRGTTILLILFTSLFIASPTNQGVALAWPTGSKITLTVPPLPAGQKGRYGQLSATAYSEYKDLQQAVTEADWRVFDLRIQSLDDKRLAATFAGLKLLSPQYTPTADDFVSWLSANKGSVIAAQVYARALSVLKSPETKRLPRPTLPAIRLTGGDWEADGRSSTRDAPPTLLAAVVKFFNGDDSAARTAIGDNDAPLALWTTGLAAWRQGDTAAARDAFTRMAALDDIHDWDRASALFWQGRAARAMGDKSAANRAFRDAVKAAPRSFYGLLAAQSLGTTPEFNWQMPNPGMPDYKELSSLSGGERALMWLELGDRKMAELEMRQLVRSATPAQRRAMLLIAHAERIPGLTYALAGYARGKQGQVHMPALYPLPAWQPGKEGYTTSAALMFALMRQESAFDTTAKSGRGAVGLMQLMPDTAQRMARTSDEKQFILANLSQPETSIDVGERYVKSLAQSPLIRGNLVRLIAAYNCGPGNLQRWLGNMPSGGDPLLFIETLPARETRDFVENVLANFWVYQTRLGEQPTSLAAMANGNWPQFDQGEVTTIASAQ